MRSAAICCLVACLAALPAAADRPASPRPNDVGGGGADADPPLLFHFKLEPDCSADVQAPYACRPPSRNLMRRPIAEVRAAAEAGSAYDQFILGFVHWMGRRAPYDPVRAEMWFTLAAEGGHKGAAWAKAALAHELSPAQRAEVASLVAHWHASHDGKTHAPGAAIVP